MENTELLRYPIGKFKYDPAVKNIGKDMERLLALPATLRSAVNGLSDAQLDTAYRQGGWTLRQVVHHLPDSHMNAYIRFKLAITEENPIIRTYKENIWAECKEARFGDILISLNLLSALHIRWVEFLKSLNEDDFERTYHHPEHNKNIKLKEVLNMYAWHGEHHLGHILQTRNRLGM